MRVHGGRSRASRPPGSAKGAGDSDADDFGGGEPAPAALCLAIAGACAGFVPFNLARPSRSHGRRRQHAAGLSGRRRHDVSGIAGWRGSRRRSWSGRSSPACDPRHDARHRLAPPRRPPAAQRRARSSHPPPGSAVGLSTARATGARRWKDRAAARLTLKLLDARDKLVDARRLRHDHSSERVAPSRIDQIDLVRAARPQDSLQLARKRESAKADSGRQTSPRSPSSHQTHTP